jgi:heptosyltransferase-1
MNDLRSKQFQRILIVKLSAIGDVAMATPFARGLKDLYPDARIEWLVEPMSADLLRGNPFLDDVLVWDRSKGKGLAGIGRFGADLRVLRRRLRGRFDLAVDLQGLGRSALATWASGAPVRLGKSSAREGGRALLTDRVSVEEPTFRAALQYTEILRSLGHPEPPVELEIFPDEANAARADAILAGLGGARIASIAYATTRPYKHWTNAAFARTIDLLHETFGLESVLHGGPGDIALGEEIAALCRIARPRIIAGRTTLRDAAEVIRRSQLLVGVDTGLMHFGMAMRTPTIAIFGPTNAHRLRDEPFVTALQKAGPRIRGNAVRRREWWNDRSIDENTPEDVIEAARALMALMARSTAAP